MTVEDRYVLDLADIRAVRFECGTCGTAISFKAADWTKIPSQCLNCGVSWHSGENTDEFKTINRFSLGLRGTVALLKEAGFRLRLELDRPKA